jgi:hypothetical protein
MKLNLLLFLSCAALSLTVAAQNVGIGTNNPVNKLHVNGDVKLDSNLYITGNTGMGILSPAYKLDVAGIINTNSNMYVGGFLGVGTTAPIYKIQVDNGSLAVHNTSDSKYWVMNYNSSSNYFNLSEDGTNRLAILNGGNVGIGTTVPSAKLEVVGNTELNGTVNVTGALTVNNNKGVIYNAGSATNLRYYTRTASFTVSNLAPHTLSAEGTITLSGFTNPPQVFAGNIIGNNGSLGPLYQLQLVIYDVTATSCHCRILNSSDVLISQNITWNIMCVGN